MTKTFKGRPIIAGNLKGECIVTEDGLNILATYQTSAIAKSKKAICADQNNKYLYKKDLTQKIICLPQTIGSTTGGMVLQTVTEMGIGPKAMLFSNHIDSLAAAGVILSSVWSGINIVTVDGLGDEFLKSIKSGQTIDIKEDGTVTVEED